MSGRPTDHANRDLTQLNLDIWHGRAGGQIIWQPRIGCWRDDKRFHGEPLPEPYEHLDMPGIFRHLNCTTRIYDFNACFQAVEDPQVVVKQEWVAERDLLTTVETPVGTQTDLQRTTPTNKGVLRPKRWIETEQDFRVATWRAERTTWRWNQELYDQLCETWAGLGAPTMYLPRENIQDLFINTMGVERAIYALVDWPETVEAYFTALDECHDRMVDVVAASPIEIVNHGDNLHGRTLSPELFRRYVLPVYQRHAERLHAVGKFVHAHWDGEVRSLLPFAKETGLDGIEAITPEPQGDVTLEEVKEALGDDMMVLDGIPAIYFDEMWPVEVLEECTHKVIELFAPKLILGISDELSSHGDIERCRVVGSIVDDYNARVAAQAATF